MKLIDRIAKGLRDSQQMFVNPPYLTRCVTHRYCRVTIR
jgi:hypothetical protein